MIKLVSYHTMQFDLVPVRPCPAVSSLSVSVAFGDEFDIEWRVAGDMSALVWPAVTDAPSRVMGLWEATCFECFLGREEDPGYLELNVSPSGNWNSFAFVALREGMHETTRLECLGSQASVDAQSGTLSARLALESDIATARHLWLGLSAVLADHEGQLHYFALGHETPRPDFHDRRNHRLITPPADGEA